MVNVEVIDPPSGSSTEDGASDNKGLLPEGEPRVATKLTVPENPKLVTVTTEVADPPATNCAGLAGDAVTWKPCPIVTWN